MSKIKLLSPIQTLILTMVPSSFIHSGSKSESPFFASISKICEFPLQGALPISIHQVQAFIILYLIRIRVFPSLGIYLLAGSKFILNRPRRIFRKRGGGRCLIMSLLVVPNQGHEPNHTEAFLKSTPAYFLRGSSHYTASYLHPQILQPKHIRNLGHSPLSALCSLYISSHEYPSVLNAFHLPYLLQSLC